MKFDPRDEDSIKAVMAKANVVINLIGTYFVYILRSFNKQHCSLTYWMISLLILRKRVRDQKFQFRRGEPSHGRETCIGMCLNPEIFFPG